MFGKFTNFNEMITPGLIKIIYYISLAFVAIFGVIAFIGSLIAGEVGVAFGTLLFSALVFLMVRVYCELIILGFKAVEYLKNINDKLNASGGRDQFNDY